MHAARIGSRLGLPEVAIIVSVWLVPLGAHVLPGTAWWNCWRGTRPWISSRRCAAYSRQRLVLEDERVLPGQVLGLIKSRATGYELDASGCRRLVDLPRGLRQEVVRQRWTVIH